MRDLFLLALELVGYRWLDQSRQDDGSSRWERMSDQEQIATKRRYHKRSFYMHAFFGLGGCGIAAAALVLWERHQIAAAVTVALGVAAAVASVAAAFLTRRVLRSHPWPPMDPTAALEAIDSDARVRYAANLAVGASVAVSIGVSAAWIIYTLPGG